MEATKSLFSGLSIHGIEFVHLLAFASWFGMLQYTTWVAGIVMFNNLPKHQFGNLQSKLFPWYFSLGTIFNTINIGTFYLKHPFVLTRLSNNWLSFLSDEHALQFVILFSALLFNLTNLLILGPKTTSIMFQRHKIEKEAQSEQNERELKKLNRNFGILHGVSSLVNLLIVAATSLHLIFISNRINL